MEGQNKKKRNNKAYVAGVVIFVGVAVAVAAVLFLLFRENRTYITEEKGETDTSSLYCAATEPSEAFFVSDKATSVTHSVKVILRDGKPDKFEYDYEGIFGTEAEADTARSELHADYNKYMGGRGLDQESLYPTFNYDGAKAKIKLYGEKGSSLNTATAKFFFLDGNEFAVLGNDSAEDLKKIYTGKGFSCSFNE